MGKSSRHHDDLLSDRPSSERTNRPRGARSIATTADIMAGGGDAKKSPSKKTKKQLRSVSTSRESSVKTICTNSAEEGDERQRQRELRDRKNTKCSETKRVAATFDSSSPSPTRQQDGDGLQQLQDLEDRASRYGRRSNADAASRRTTTQRTTTVRAPVDSKKERNKTQRKNKYDHEYQYDSVLDETTRSATISGSSREKKKKKKKDKRTCSEWRSNCSRSSPSADERGDGRAYRQPPYQERYDPGADDRGSGGRGNSQQGLFQEHLDARSSRSSRATFNEKDKKRKKQKHDKKTRKRHYDSGSDSNSLPAGERGVHPARTHQSEESDAQSSRRDSHIDLNSLSHALPPGAHPLGESYGTALNASAVTGWDYRSEVHRKNPPAAPSRWAGSRRSSPDWGEDRGENRGERKSKKKKSSRHSSPSSFASNRSSKRDYDKKSRKTHRQRCSTIREYGSQDEGADDYMEDHYDREPGQLRRGSGRRRSDSVAQPPALPTSGPVAAWEKIRFLAQKHEVTDEVFREQREFTQFYGLVYEIDVVNKDCAEAMYRYFLVTCKLCSKQASHTTHLDSKDHKRRMENFLAMTYSGSYSAYAASEQYCPEVPREPYVHDGHQYNNHPSSSTRAGTAPSGVTQSEPRYGRPRWAGPAPAAPELSSSKDPALAERRAAEQRYKEASIGAANDEFYRQNRDRARLKRREGEQERAGKVEDVAKENQKNAQEIFNILDTEETEGLDEAPTSAVPPLRRGEKAAHLQSQQVEQKELEPGSTRREHQNQLTGTRGSTESDFVDEELENEFGNMRGHVKQIRKIRKQKREKKAELAAAKETAAVALRELERAQERIKELSDELADLEAEKRKLGFGTHGTTQRIHVCAENYEVETSDDEVVAKRRDDEDHAKQSSKKKPATAGTTSERNWERDDHATPSVVPAASTREKEGKEDRAPHQDTHSRRTRRDHRVDAVEERETTRRSAEHKNEAASTHRGKVSAHPDDEARSRKSKKEKKSRKRSTSSSFLERFQFESGSRVREPHDDKLSENAKL
ncbi:unnamed protein product [Amoebophrya sp. A120]|nr:unnamed protein product [Amoebophrya sp. A120]|eukprot:GSA120T00022619001.1